MAISTAPAARRHYGNHALAPTVVAQQLALGLDRGARVVDQLRARGLVGLRVEQQQQVLASLEFKCDVLWAQLDALYHAYVAPGHIPPGAFRLKIRNVPS